jgi:hypothetical protein
MADPIQTGPALGYPFARGGGQEPPTFDPVSDASIERLHAMGAEPSLMERFMTWLASIGRGPQAQQQAGRGVADAMNAKLPPGLSARPGIQQAAERRKRLIDDQQQ